MAKSLVLAIPSKGRLQEKSVAFFQDKGLTISRSGERSYSGHMADMEHVEISLLSSGEISRKLISGEVDFGITGLDLIMEDDVAQGASVHKICPLGFGFADVVTAVPEFWVDANNMLDLIDISSDFITHYGRRMRVATKYFNLARRFFAHHQLLDYRLVESAGATEGAPLAGTADIIVDITTTGATLAANNLKIPEDGIILKSEAHLFAARHGQWSSEKIAMAQQILDKLQATQEHNELVEDFMQACG